MNSVEIHDLSSLQWTLTGFNPWEWRLGKSLETNVVLAGEVAPFPARVPGSIQKNLRDAGLLPDWNLGLNYRACEWVENRHWVYETTLPREYLAGEGPLLILAPGIDGPGQLVFDNATVGTFDNSHIPHRFDLRPHVHEKGAGRLRFIFTCPPRWLGQFGRTSEMVEAKVRFNYFWDWTSRLVQMGFHEGVFLQTGEAYFATLTARTEYRHREQIGRVFLGGEVVAPPDALLSVILRDGNHTVSSWNGRASDLSRGGVALEVFKPRAWFPHGLGDQALYPLEIKLLDGSGGLLHREERTVGFTEMSWKQNPGCRADADPWWFHINGQGLFLAGINWTPILPNFADATEGQYRKLLTRYRDLGFHLMRVWGGATLERECFYRICDELGLLVWQEFPLSSSGLDNMPPDGGDAVTLFGNIARTYLERRMHHVSVAVWCGGNELRHTKDSNRPVGLSHPMMRRFAEVTRALDPSRRFVTSTPSGPSFGASEADYGKGLHWAVNGPWTASGRLEEKWFPYFSKDDSLLRSETGLAGASSAELIRRYDGGLPNLPVSKQNPLWARQPWWVEGEQFRAEHGHEAKTLEEYVDWSQERQSRGLAHAMGAAVDRYPACGGFFIWMGHDSFPCCANTSIIDFDGQEKPAAKALAEVIQRFRSKGSPHTGLGNSSPRPPSP